MMQDFFNIFLNFFLFQGTKAEKVMQLSSVKCYLGLKKKLKPPTRYQETNYVQPKL